MQSQPEVTKLIVDDSKARFVLERLLVLFAQHPSYFTPRFIDELITSFDESFDVSRVYGIPATGAREMRYVFHLPKRFRELVATITFDSELMTALRTEIT